jgi:hypothetical protein
MPLRAGLHLAVWVFPARDYPRMLLETTWLGFIGGWGGHQPLFSPMERRLPLLTLSHAR